MTKTEEFKQILQQSIAKAYAPLTDKTEALEIISTKIIELLNELRHNSEAMYAEQVKKNEEEYHRSWCSGNLSYDIINNALFDIIYEHLPYDIIVIDGKEYRDYDDAHTDATYDITELVELIYNGGAALLEAAIPAVRAYRAVCEEKWAAEDAAKKNAQD